MNAGIGTTAGTALRVALGAARRLWPWRHPRLRRWLALSGVVASLAWLGWLALVRASPYPVGPAS